jgi:glycosyltransferase involved in cell wall biosynthesis
MKSRFKKQIISPVRVLYLIDDLDVGGTEQQILELVKGIDKNRFIPFVCCLNLLGAVSREIEGAGIKVFLIKKKSRFDISVIPKLIRFINENEISIVHTFLFTANTWGRTAAILAKVPIIIASETNVDLWKKPIHFIIDKVLSYFSAHIIVNAAAIKDFLILRTRIKDEKFIVIKNGFNLGRLETDLNKAEMKKKIGLLDDAVVVGTIGRLENQKDHETFLKSAGILKLYIPGSKFIIVGDGSRRSHLEAFAKESGLGKDVLFLGKRRDIIEVVNIFDVFVLTSLYEGFPNVLLESMVLGIPPVATDVGGVQEIIDNGQNGFLVETKNPELIAEKVRDLIGDKNLYRTVSQKAKEKIQTHFSVYKMIAEHERVYGELIQLVDKGRRRLP